MTPEDLKQIDNLIVAHMDKARIERNEAIHAELMPIRQAMQRVFTDLYGQPGETGVVKLIVRHDTLLWVLIGGVALALIGIFVLVLR